jgi:dGTPase
LSSRTTRFSRDKVPDNRTAAQRDRDRILYTSAFRRLARVTQVVSAGEGHVFHNRLTHSIQVAQVGRRIAEKLIADGEKAGQPIEDINPDVVEAACLAHDLGHPPFGHVAEQELDKLARASCLLDGFEGNAQSFRIVTNLASASSIGPGLNLTRATLNGILKYPWLRGENPEKLDKWGAYETEREYFNWARVDYATGDRKFQKSPEAELMDLADDITYSVHDVDDFYRAGLMPIDRLRIDSREQERFFEGVFRREAGKLPKGMDESYLRRKFKAFIDKITIEKPYEGTRRDRNLLRDFTAATIGDFVRAVTVITVGGDSTVDMLEERRAEIFMLKQLTWQYVIKAPALTTQQYGQRTIIRELFEIFSEAAAAGDEKNLDVFPLSVREELQAIHSLNRSTIGQECNRAVVDLIASFTEEQAIDAYYRLTGIALGSALLHRWR